MNWKGYYVNMICRDTLVIMNDGSLKNIQDLRAGDIVKDGFKVKQILEHDHSPCDVANVSGIRISLWHPIHMGVFWVFPVHNAQTLEIDVREQMYDIVLESGHYLVFHNGIRCCTLGHGLTDFVAKHKYFGTEKVLEDLEPLGSYFTAKSLHVMRDVDVYKWIFYVD